MIGSFWNLCRACPSMPVDKLHSEYRSTYRWHEFTGNSRPEVVRRAPAPNPSQFIGPTNEPPLPRRKKCPELAYKSHEFIIGTEYTDARAGHASVNRLARSEERGTPSRRSKSEGPPIVPNGRAYAIPEEVDGAAKKQAATLHELEPLVSDVEESKPNEKQVTIVEKVERKMTIRPFSQAFDQERINHFITKKENFGFEAVKDKGVGDEIDNRQQEKEVLLNGTAPPRSQPNLDLWFKEVVELRKKAGEYKCRGWGMEIDPELYKKQRDLWDQVSKRSSLSALSLASSVHRPITKEEKEQENNKKSIPLNVEEGALLPSPTREKLMPAITKRESESQRGSPKKTAASRHGSPQKGSPQKGSPKKVIKYDAEDGRETAISVSSCSPQPAPEIPDEPIVKSPPEPTRVKSPEQILMRSPDPVNWTVPLDTGKTFTVTQNVKEGESYSRPQSEIKASTPVEKPPPPPQSAPPQLTEQAKMDAWKHTEAKKSITSPTGGINVGRTIVATQPIAGTGGLPSPPSTKISGGKPIPGSTLRCLDDPIFDVDIGYLVSNGGIDGGIGVSGGGGGNTSSSSTSTTTAVTARTTANDVLEKARDRFDRFWGGRKEEHV